jgi:ankyrin repeat protein
MDYKLKYLKYKQKYIGLKNQFGGNYIFWDAIRDNDYKKVKEIILNDSKILTTKYFDSETPLMYAVVNGSIDIVILLLVIAIRGNLDNLFSLNICEAKMVLLKSKGTKIKDIDLKNSKGLTALIIASIYGHEQIIRLLLDGGADINAKDNDGYTSLLYATIKGNEQIVKLLLENKADINAKDNDFNTSLMLASYFCKKNVAKLLLENNPDINTKNKSNETALKIAVQRECKYVTDLLSKYKKNI